VPKAELIEVSRVATFAASLDEFNVQNLLRIWSQYRAQSMKALFKSLDIDIEKYDEYFKKYDIDKVIFSGVAGALDKALKIGDIVIANDVVQHDFAVEAFGYKKGQIPQMEVWSFEGDKGLIKKVQETSDEKIKLHYGRILTGDQFIYKKEEKLDLGKEFEALCVDMESGAVAQVCYIMNVKFLIIRSISDSVTDESSMEYDKFAELAAENSKEILKKIIN